MFGKRLFQFGALVFSVTLVGTYVYVYSRGTAAPRSQLQQVEGVSEVTPAIGAVDRPPLTIRLNSEQPDNFIRSTKSFIVFPPSSTTPLESLSPKGNGIDTAPKTPVDGPSFTKDFFFSSSKSGMIIDPSLIPSQSASSVPQISVQSTSGYTPPEVPPTNQPTIRK